MTAIHETAYPRLKPHPTPTELEKNFKPTFDERMLMEDSTRKTSEINKLGFMILLKCYQCLGYAINLKDVPEAIISYVSKALGGPDNPDLTGYLPSAKKRHRKIILKFLNISDDNHKQRNCIKRSALKSAAFKEGLADIINDMIETLIKERFELPGFTTLERMARAARALTSTKLYERITARLSDESKIFLDRLFDTALAPDNATTRWAYLKQEMKAPTTQNVKTFVENLDLLKDWRSKASAVLGEISAHRLEQLIEEATALDSSDMKDLRQDKRYALAVTMLHFKLANGLDSIASVLIRWMRKMRHEASQELDAYTLAKKNETDRLVEILYNVLLASKVSGRLCFLAQKLL